MSESESMPERPPELFVLDVDGVMTTGHFLYSEDGKVLKIFGGHDADGLKMLRGKLDIQFITADRRGFSITKRRIVDDMGYPLRLVSESERADFFRDEIGYERTVFMADGYHDAPILKNVMLGVAPADARQEAIRAADYVTVSKAGHGAVMDASLYLLGRYFAD